MVSLFFYKHLMNTELIEKINNEYTMLDGYVLVQNYDDENNTLEIHNKPQYNDKILYGKIVSFDMRLVDVVEIINEIDECKLPTKKSNTKSKYTLESIWVNKNICGTIKAYIIYKV